MFGVNIHGLTFMSISIEVLKIRQLFFIYAYDLYIKTYCREINIHVRKKKNQNMEGKKIFSILIVICLVMAMLARESTALSALRRIAM